MKEMTYEEMVQYKGGGDNALTIGGFSLGELVQCAGAVAGASMAAVGASAATAGLGTWTGVYMVSFAAGYYCGNAATN